ncbi:hypothetical protein D3C87_1276830 [compost metagenome]
MKNIISKPLNIIIALILFLGSCKKDRQTNEQKTPARLLKSINTNNSGFSRNFIVNYGADGHVSYVGSSDFTTGYYYIYTGVQISGIVHKIGDLQYELILTYSDNRTLSKAEFKVKNSLGVISSFPLTCEQIGDLNLVSSNSNDLTFLQLHLVDGKLIKSSTNAWYLKSSINFQYNNQNGRIFGDVLPVSKLNNPLNPATGVRVNELISLFLQVFSPKQLIAFQVQQSSGKLNYNQNLGDLTAIECMIDSVDAGGNVIKTTKTDINYSYTN